MKKEKRGIRLPTYRTRTRGTTDPAHADENGEDGTVLNCDRLFSRRDTTRTLAPESTELSSCICTLYSVLCMHVGRGSFGLLCSGCRWANSGISSSDTFSPQTKNKEKKKSIWGIYGSSSPPPFYLVVQMLLLGVWGGKRREVGEWGMAAWSARLGKSSWRTRLGIGWTLHTEGVGGSYLAYYLLCELIRWLGSCGQG